MRVMSTESLQIKLNQTVGKVVLPQIVEDKSIIDSFTGFIQDVVPQACGGSTSSDTKDKILWARFENTDLNDPIFYSEIVEPISSGPPILLILGYGFGIQVWHITANGEATEILSWYQGSTKIFKLIPSPQVDSNGKLDLFAHRRPLAAICDSLSSPQYYSLSFVSLRGGELVKSIKFKSSILDVAVNRISIILSFIEKIAIFNALTLENHHTITTCYASVGLNLNPICVGSRWLAYSEQKLIPWFKSAGGCDSDGVSSYTATVLNAAKTLGQGLRDLSGSVANSLSGSLSTSPVSYSYMNMASGFQRSESNSSINSINSADSIQPGVVTIIDIQTHLSDADADPKNGIVAHFVAHAEPIVALNFDPSGVLLLTADKRGHRFHVFKIQPHLLGSAYSAVHHLYILYRGDTTARVQDMVFSVDSRWIAVTTLRGTTHVFPITPYGGPVGLRTHSTPHVVNKLSRFHRSAGIVTDGRSSPVFHETPTMSSSPTSMSFPNVCLPPFPHPTVLAALAQIRHHNRLLQSRHSSPQGYDENNLPSVKVAATFSTPRMLEGLVKGNTNNKKCKNAADSLFVVSSHGLLIQYDLEPVPAAGLPRDKLCDESAIELKVEAKVKWFLLQPYSVTSTVQPPLSSGNPLLSTNSSMKQDFLTTINNENLLQVDEDDKWLSQVEIITHIGPHRRIWMGPQFTFKQISRNGSSDLESSDINVAYTAKSNPVNLPTCRSNFQSSSMVPLFIESDSNSSLDPSPCLMEAYGGDSDSSVGNEELKICEDLADAMLESPVNAVIKSEVSDLEVVENSDTQATSRKTRRNKKKRK